MANYRRRKKNQRKDNLKFRVNERIRAQEIRVIDNSDGETEEMVGVMSVPQALKLALEKEVDLVEVNPKASPPVCKLIDYNKFKYNLQKSTKNAKAKEEKTLRVSVRVSDNDLQVRGNQAAKFVQKGHKVKLQVQMRGREKAYPEVANEIINKFLSYIDEEVFTVESPPKLNGDSYYAHIKPSKGGSKSEQKTDEE